MRAALLAIVACLSLVAAPASAMAENFADDDSQNEVRCPPSLPRGVQGACQTVSNLVDCIQTSRRPLGCL